MNLLKVIPVSGVTNEDIRTHLYSPRRKPCTYPSLEALYVSNGTRASRVRHPRRAGRKIRV